MQVFSEGYANSQVYQLPLIQGSPSEHMLRQLSRQPCQEWLSRALRNGTVSVTFVIDELSQAVFGITYQFLEQVHLLWIKKKTVHVILYNSRVSSYLIPITELTESNAQFREGSQVYASNKCGLRPNMNGQFMKICQIVYFEVFQWWLQLCRWNALTLWQTSLESNVGTRTHSVLVLAANFRLIKRSNNLHT